MIEAKYAFSGLENCRAKICHKITLSKELCADRGRASRVLAVVIMAPVARVQHRPKEHISRRV